jgi:hypothetical protein
VRFALDGALTRSDVVDGGELLASISNTWPAIGLDAEGLARCDAYLAKLPPEQPRLRARISTTLAYFLGECGRKVRALDVATEAVDDARASGDAALLATALREYASQAMVLQRIDDAERALADAEAIPGTSANLRIALLGTRARFSQIRDDLDSAERSWEQLRKESHALGNTRGEHVAAANLAENQHARGATRQAIAAVRDLLPAMRSGADTNLLLSVLSNLAGYLAAVDDLSGAIAAAHEAIQMRAAREPDHTHVAIAIEHLALVAALRGDCLRAARLEGYVDAAFARYGFPREPTEKTTHDRLTARLRESLERDELARLIAEGAVLTSEGAIALALEECESA